MMKQIRTIMLAALAVLSLSAVSCSGPKDGTYTFQLFTTNDVHGCYFDSVYVGNRTRNSLLAVSAYVDSVRNAVGKDKVILVDAGDCLQGDNAAYYYNYVDTVSTHLYCRIVDYMGYDAVVVGNHDIETGHPVYDRVVRQMKTPFLAGNAISDATGRPYFQDHVILKRDGIKIAILGFTNPNMKNWLSYSLWSGMTFESLLPLVQEDVDKVIAKEKPQVVIVAVHSGTGEGDGGHLESQGLDLFNSLKGVDFLVCAHDHRPFVAEKDSLCLINSGSHCRNIGHGTVTLEIKDGKCISKTLSADLIPVRKEKTDTLMKEMFMKDYQAVKDFTVQPVGELKTELRTRDAYMGMCDYVNLIHAISLGVPEARLSFAAPLTFNGYIRPGVLTYNDLFTIYPFENQLYVVKMSGKEIKDYLEYSYSTWVNTVKGRGDEHILQIVNEPDPRTGQKRWSFVGRSYNFDSAGGLFYDVDVTEPVGQRVKIKSLADGTPFCSDSTYNVAMTSYRASGGGGIMREGAGIDTDSIDTRIVARYPEIRELVYDYLKKNGSIDAEVIGDPSLIGAWHFTPEPLADKLMKKDMSLLFPQRK